MAAKLYKNSSGKRLPSVTTIIGRFKESGALLYWANSAGLDGLTLDEARKPAATAGTIAHGMVEDYLHKRPARKIETEDEEIIGKARNAFDAFLSWQSMVNLNVRHTEVSLCSEKHAFGGTLDAIGTIKGGNDLCLVDWKSSAKVYADYLYQVAAYKVLWEENYPEHPITGGCHICRFAKDDGDFSHHFFSNVDHEVGVFLQMRDLYDKIKTTEKRVR